MRGKSEGHGSVASITMECDLMGLVSQEQLKD